MKDIYFPVTFMNIESLAGRWKCGIATIQMLAETDQIKLFVRPVALEVALGCTQTDQKLFRALCDRPLARQDVYLLFRDRRTTVSIRGPDPNTPPISMAIEFNDLIIPLDIIEAFEQRYRMPHNRNFSFKLLSDDFTCFVWNGREYTFGLMQAKIIKRLWQAREDGTPWVHGKYLLSESGSGSDRIKNIFSRNQNWRRLIVSDRKGKYKLNMPPKTNSPTI